MSSAAEGPVSVVALEQLGSGFMSMTPVATEHHEDVQDEISHLIPGWCLRPKIPAWLFSVKVISYQTP